MTAARAGRLEVVRALVARGATVNLGLPSSGQTALMWAAAEGHADVVEALLAAQRGEEIGERVAAPFAAAHLRGEVLAEGEVGLRERVRRREAERGGVGGFRGVEAQEGLQQVGLEEAEQIGRAHV